MVIYEWSDAKYLGKITSTTDESLPVSQMLHSVPANLGVSLAEIIRLYSECRSEQLLWT